MPTNGFMGDPSLASAELGERVAERTAEHIAAEVRRYLTLFSGRRQRVPPPAADGR